MLYTSNNRMQFIDIFKALAIFLVVLGHLPAPLRSLTVTQWIYSFHMPAFFAVYGMTYNLNRHAVNGWLNGSFLKRKVKRLLVPCFAWGLVYASFSIKNLAYVAYGSQASFIRASSLSSLWFLTCMFLTVCIFELLMCLLFKLEASKVQWIIMIAIAIILFIVGASLPRTDIGFPWCVDIMPVGVGFVIVGYGIKTIILRLSYLKEEQTSAWLIIFLISVAITFLYIPNLTFVSGNNVDMASRRFGNMALYVLTAIGGIVMLTALSVLLAKIKGINRIAVLGVYSMPVFLLHKFPIVAVSSYLVGMGYTSCWLGLLIVVLIIILCYFVSRILEVFAPNLIGLDIQL